MGAHSTEAPQTPDTLSQSGVLRKGDYKSQHARRLRRRRAACPVSFAYRWPALDPKQAATPEVPRRAGGPSAPAAMAAGTAAALLAALGGILWLAARRFVGSSVQRLHQKGGDSGLMRGKTVLITGSERPGPRHSGRAVAPGGSVIMGCRDRERAEEAAGQLRREVWPTGGPDSGPTLRRCRRARRPRSWTFLAELRRVLLSRRCSRCRAREPAGDPRPAIVGVSRRTGAGPEGPWVERGRTAHSRGGVTLGMTEARSRND